MASQSAPHGGNFDHAADDYDEKAAKFFKFHTSVVQEIRQRLPKDTKQNLTLFEFGCGTGNVCLSLASEFQHVYGVDVSEKMLQKAQQKITQQAIVNATLQQLDLQDPKQLADIHFPPFFDYVVCCMVLHHLPDPMAKLGLFQKILSKEGGHLVIVEFGESEDGRSHSHAHHHHYHHHHTHDDQKGDTVEKPQAHGLDNDETRNHDTQSGSEHPSPHHHHHSHNSSSQASFSNKKQEIRNQYGILSDGFDAAKLHKALESLGFSKFDSVELPPLEGMEKDHPLFGLPIIISFASN